MENTINYSILAHLSVTLLGLLVKAVVNWCPASSTLVIAAPAISSRRPLGSGSPLDTMECSRFLLGPGVIAGAVHHE